MIHPIIKAAAGAVGTGIVGGHLASRIKTKNNLANHAIKFAGTTAGFIGGAHIHPHKALAIVGAYTAGTALHNIRKRRMMVDG